MIVLESKSMLFESYQMVFEGYFENNTEKEMMATFLIMEVIAFGFKDYSIF